MARIRTIKPDAFQSDSLVLVDFFTRWTFAGIWTYLDDEGYGRADPRLVKAALFALDDDVTVDDVRAAIDRLSSIECLCLYEVDGKAYMHSPQWKAHQRVNRPTPSKLPHCPTCDNTGRGTPHPRLTEDSVRDQGGLTIGREGKGREVADATPPRPEVEALCTRLADRIEANGSKRPSITKTWRDAARLLLDRDERDIEEAERLIDWCQASDFWRPNILSMGKFREKYDTLRLQAERDAQKRGTAEVDPWAHVPFISGKAAGQ